jgi:hypothetical protein
MDSTCSIFFSMVMALAVYYRHQKDTDPINWINVTDSASLPTGGIFILMELAARPTIPMDTSDTKSVPAMTKIRICDLILNAF